MGSGSDGASLATRFRQRTRGRRSCSTTTFTSTAANSESSGSYSATGNDPVNTDDLNRYAHQRISKISAPLIAEIGQRLEIDLGSDCLAAGMLEDFADRLFTAGFNFGAANATAEMLEQRPDLELVFEGAPPTFPERLGDDDEFEADATE